MDLASDDTPSMVGLDPLARELLKQQRRSDDRLVEELKGLRADLTTKLDEVKAAVGKVDAAVTRSGLGGLLDLVNRLPPVIQHALGTALAGLILALAGYATVSLTGLPLPMQPVEVHSAATTGAATAPATPAP